ncbi:MAG: amidase [Burkholderiales bacterium]|nr:amidase [Burkholderiales bacterium]
MTETALPPAQGLDAITRALRRGESTSVGLVEATFARIAALEPKLQAFTHLDEERALMQARGIDLLREAGVDLGPLMGVPVAVKDLFSVDGMPTRAGSAIDIGDLVPPQGGFVNALYRAGCVLVGKTRTTEFALGGCNLNRPPPWNPCDMQQARMTGGSSHGSAVAMAAGLAGFTAGTDTGGSVRWPAALCGVVGYKASTTHWPRDGVFPLSPLLDSVGVFTASARDAALVEASIAGRIPQARRAASGLRLALPGPHFLEDLDPAVGACFEEALKRLRAAGAAIFELDLPEAAEINEVFRCLVPVDLLAFLGRKRVNEQWERFDLVASQRLQAALSVSADDYVRMATRQRALEHLIHQRAQGIDAWIMPTVPVLPEPLARYTTVEDVGSWNNLATRNTRPCNLFNQCGISLPIQHLGASLPVGLQLCSSCGNDAALLQTAIAVEDALH